MTFQILNNVSLLRMFNQNDEVANRSLTNLVLDFMDVDATIALIFGYFRKHEMLKSNVRMNDFVSIVLNYICDNKKIEFGDNSINITSFDGNIVNDIDASNKQFIVGINERLKQMLSEML